jgi:uncharacterized protein (DUF2126 family)
MKGLSRQALMAEARGYGLDIETAGIERLREYVKLMRDVPAADHPAVVGMVNCGYTAKVVRRKLAERAS